MSGEKKIEEDSKTGGDNIRNLFTMVKREGKVFLKEGMGLGEGKRASKSPILCRGTLFWGTNNYKHARRFSGTQPEPWAA